jgi:hypothetical protein
MKPSSHQQCVKDTGSECTRTCQNCLTFLIILKAGTNVLKFYVKGKHYFASNIS